jgi:uncharacterized membrane protein
MKKLDIIILGFIIVIALALRLYNINTPLADFHSWRQADTAAVARNFSRDGFDLMHPRYDDISSIQTGIENPNGYRFVEFPLYSAIFGVLYKYLPITSLEVYGRLTSIFFSLVIIGVIYYLSLKEHSRHAAIFASIIYAIMPFFVFFSRVILPETTALSFMFLAIFFLYLFIQNKKRNFIYLVTSIIFYALSVLIKPTTIFYSFALGYLFVMEFRFELFKRWEPYIYFILGLVPFVLWRLYIRDYPEGIPASDWLFTHVNTSQGLLNIFFKPAFFRWIFIERIGIIMMGVYLSGFFLVGIVSKYKKYFVHSILFSAVVYLCTFQGGNVQHEYYQTIILPALAMTAGFGIAQLVRNNQNINTIIAYPVIIVAFVFSFMFSYYKVRDWYNYAHDLPEIAKLIMTFTKPEDRIVTDRVGDTTLLYLADRKGAPATYKDIPVLKELGYSYFVTDKKDVTASLKEKGYQVLVENDQFSIIKL